MTRFVWDYENVLEPPPVSPVGHFVCSECGCGYSSAEGKCKYEGGEIVPATQEDMDRSFPDGIFGYKLVTA